MKCQKQSLYSRLHPKTGRAVISRCTAAELKSCRTASLKQKPSYSSGNEFVMHLTNGQNFQTSIALVFHKNNGLWSPWNVLRRKNYIQMVADLGFGRVLHRPLTACAVYFNWDLGVIPIDSNSTAVKTSPGALQPVYLCLHDKYHTFEKRTAIYMQITSDSIKPEVRAFAFPCVVCVVYNTCLPKAIFSILRSLTDIRFNTE